MSENGQELISSSSEPNRPDRAEALRQAVVEGLRYTHSRLNANTSKTLEASSFLYALIELLEEKGLLSVAELDQRKRIVGERLVAQYRQSGNGLIVQDPECDKYNFSETVEFDCAERVHLCRAACCRLPFALSRQDVREGVVHWELGQPYLIEQRQDGYCNHLDRCTWGCTIYHQRPVPCLAFDCRQDRQIWLDYENRVINPEINRVDWPACLETKAVHHDP